MNHHDGARTTSSRTRRVSLITVVVAALALLAPVPFASSAVAAGELITVTEAPRNFQVTPRGADNTAVVPVAGTINGSGVQEVRLVVTGNGGSQTFTSASASFRFTPKITAGLFEYTFQLTAVGPGVNQVVDTREHVVAGDVFVIQGQSNAVAAPYNGSSAAEISPYIRSFGDFTPDQAASAADRAWYTASGDAGPGYVGQWGIHMARRIVDTNQVPVAVINGAQGGQPIGFFQRNDANPNDIATNYGRLRQRLQAAGVIGQVKAVLWYQGEYDYNDDAAHRTGFTNLLQDWKEDIGTTISGGSKYYVTQIRTQGCGDRNPVNVREAQRQFGDTLGVTLLSTTALDAHDGCHYAYVGGYREFGDEVFANLNRDFYGGPSAGVATPNPLKVTASGSQLTVQLRSTDPLTIEAGIADDFVVVGSSVTVTSVVFQPGGQLVLSLSGPSTGITGLIHRSHIGNGPAITNATGTGLLAFQLPVESAGAVVEPALVGENVGLASRGAVATSSGVDRAGVWGPEAAIDNGYDGLSRWASEHSDTAWLQVKLAAPTTVDHVKIAWEAACAGKYKIQTSTNGSTWVDATAQLTGNCSATDTVRLSNTGPVQFVRMQGIQRTPVGGVLYGISIWEFEIWNGSEPVRAALRG